MKFDRQKFFDVHSIDIFWMSFMFLMLGISLDLRSHVHELVLPGLVVIGTFFTYHALGPLTVFDLQRFRVAFTCGWVCWPCYLAIKYKLEHHDDETSQHET